MAFSGTSDGILKRIPSLSVIFYYFKKALSNRMKIRRKQEKKSLVSKIETKGGRPQMAAQIFVENKLILCSLCFQFAFEKCFPKYCVNSVLQWPLYVLVNVWVSTRYLDRLELKDEMTSNILRVPVYEGHRAFQPKAPCFPEAMFSWCWVYKFFCIIIYIL